MTRPTVSIVLATRNRARRLAHTLTHLTRVASGAAVGLEVVVVDNGSEDDTPEVLSGFSRHLPLVTASEPEPGKNRALNVALQLARGELVLFTDDDVIPVDGWIDGIVHASRRWKDHEIFGGRVVPRYPPGRGPALPDPGFAGWAYARWDPQDEEGPTDELPFGPNFAVRSASLDGITLDETIGPGAAGMGSETAFLKELVAKGCRIVCVPDATVEHVVTPEQLEREYVLRRAYRLGEGIPRWSRDETSPRIAGVPRHLWKELVQGWIGARMPFAGAQARLRAAIAHQRARGQISAYRQAG